MDTAWGCLPFVAVIALVMAVVSIPASFLFGFCVETTMGWAGRPVDIPLFHPVPIIAGILLIEVTAPMALVLLAVGLFV